MSVKALLSVDLAGAWIPWRIIVAEIVGQLGMGLIAEGVETLAHAEQLLALGCPHAQGHLFSEPQPSAAIEALLARAFDSVPARTSARTAGH